MAERPLLLAGVEMLPSPSGEHGHRFFLPLSEGDATVLVPAGPACQRLAQFAVKTTHLFITTCSQYMAGLPRDKVMRTWITTRRRLSSISTQKLSELFGKGGAGWDSWSLALVEFYASRAVLWGDPVPCSQLATHKQTS
jgi:hypothetical protein